jgi:hypothetical protein
MGNQNSEFCSSSDVRTGLILGATFGIKSVQYAVVDSLALFEGDIVLGTAESGRRSDRTPPSGPERTSGHGSGPKWLTVSLAELCDPLRHRSGAPQPESGYRCD